MGLLSSISGINPQDNRGNGISFNAEIKEQKINSVYTVKNNEASQADNKNDPYKDFEGALKDSSFGNKFMDEKELLKHGFTPKPGIKLVKDENGELKSVPDKDNPLMDMNGGKYYINEKTGEEVRVMNPRLLGDGKSVNITTDKMSNFIEYDADGRATGGVLQLKQPDGSIKIYKYDMDINGNKFIKSVETSEHDYFATYE